MGSVKNLKKDINFVLGDIIEAVYIYEMTTSGKPSDKTNAIIDEAIKHNVGVIALEDLTNIRKRIKAGKRISARLHRWAWYQLQQFIAYKAEAVGIKVGYVKPAYSSQTCHQCGAIAKREKHRLTCTCGNRAHSDLNAGLNLAWLGKAAALPRGAVNRPNVAA